MHNLLWGCAEIFAETFPNILKKLIPKLINQKSAFSLKDLN